MDVHIIASSFKEAKAILSKYYFMEWEPIRMNDTSLYRFVNPILKKAIAKDLPINKVMEKLDDSFKY
jgi:hypothetical protein